MRATNGAFATTHGRVPRTTGSRGPAHFDAGRAVAFLRRPMLSDDLLREMRDVAVDAGLDRKALLAALDPRVVASLDLATNPAAQLQVDLAALNRMGRCADGTLPLRQWIQTALASVAVHPVPLAVFRKGLRVLDMLLRTQN